MSRWIAAGIAVLFLGVAGGWTLSRALEPARPVPRDVIVYEPADFDGLDPIAPLGASPSDCDADELLDRLGDDRELLNAWARTLSLDALNVFDYVRTLRVDTLDHERPVTDHGWRDGGTYPFHAVLAVDTAVFVEEDGAPAIRCASGSPLTRPSCPPNCKPIVTPTPTPEPTPEETVSPRRPRRPTRTASPTSQPDPQTTPAPTAVPTAQPTPAPTGNGGLIP